ncbi:PTS sugar transporter subunit IIA [Bosea thiooxidans]
MKVSDCIAPGNVELDLDASNKARLLQALAEKASRGIGADERKILAALQNREKLGSTGIGAGIALPHAPIAGLERPFGLLARLGKRVDFDSIDGQPVDLVCLVLTPTESCSAHLTLLSRIARLLRSPEALARLRGAVSAQQAYAVLSEADG